MKTNKDGSPRKKKDPVCEGVPLAEFEALINKVKKVAGPNAVIPVGKKWLDALGVVGIDTNHTPVEAPTSVDIEEKPEPVQFNEVNLDEYC
jgi:hypothetical protein